MRIVGVCRFSLVGRGDWVAWRGRPDADAEGLVAEAAARLFAPGRMAARLASFEHLTLASLRAQSDRDFLFLVCASDLMPEPWRARLVALCAGVPQVVLRFFPPTDVIAAQARAFAELGIGLGDAVQFRLDDDDCVFADFVRLLRRCAGAMAPLGPFAVSFPDVICAITTGPHAGAYRWRVPFMAAGVATFNPRRSVYGFGHFALPMRLPALTVPFHHSLVTVDGTNDSAASLDWRLRSLKPLPAAELRALVKRNLPFLDADGLRVAGLAEALDGGA